MRDLPEGVPLFRPEAVAHRVDSLFGSILLPQYRVVTGLVWSAVAITVIVIIFVLTAGYTRRVQAVGWLVHEPGDAKISSPRSGIISKIWVTNGAAVSAGAPLITLSNARSSTHTADVETRILTALRFEQESLAEEIQSERDLAKSNSKRLKRQFDSSQEYIDKLKSLKDLADQRLHLAQAEHERIAKIASQGLVARVDVEKARDVVLTARLNLGEIEQRLITEEAQQASSRSDMETTALKSSQRISELEGSHSRLEQKLADIESSQDAVVRSPIDGTVSGLTVDSGQTVAANSSLLVVVPTEATLRAQILIPTRAAGFVDKNMDVRLRYDAFPYQKFGHFSGKIVSVDYTIINPADRFLPIHVDEPSYRAVIELSRQDVEAYGKRFSLQPGMTLQSDILLERRSIVEWLFDPVFAATGRL